MKEKIGYRINSEIKNDYDAFIIEKYGQKLGTVGNKIEKAMKFYLAANGNKKYQNDPDVQTILKKANKTMNNTSTIKSKSKNNSLEEIVDTKLETMKEEILAQIEKKIENRIRRESSKKHGHAEFKKQFQMAFQDYNQVIRRELEQFIMNKADIVDKRAIGNRIQYLQSHGIIQPFAPNVYNINTKLNTSPTPDNPASDAA